MIKAITFDFWDTLVLDNSDEPKRVEQGLNNKAETQVELLTAEIREYNPDIGAVRMEAAFVYANDCFRYHWKTLQLPPTWLLASAKRTPGWGLT